ncbi:ankyrin repeat-containing protein ITN1-like [Ziziphus jujuba]|uniref:Ankyrin repeat-containing protein ITN1-like n=1 Tax=Ziziphus jujuba TaxID=326968 RepID=A0ABM4AGA5_ZIZJJ|nr:ankyrin repeat-containing protein ITN1-like [Ziziphus jujuba]
MTRTRRTALHVAAMAGHTEIVETLVENMSPEDLEIKDSSGFTALTAAISYNANIKIAECMVKKNKKLPTVVDELCMPVVWAFRYCHIEMARYLYSVASIESLLSDDDNRAHAAGLINQAIMTKCYDVALHLLQHCPQLATTADTAGIAIVIDGDRVIKEIYTKPPTNPNMSSGFKKIYEMKLIHIQTSELLRRMCDEIKKLDETQMSRPDIITTLFEAVEKGNFEFVRSIFKSSPDLEEVYGFHERNIFMAAIRCRQAKLFSLIHGVRSKLKATNHRDRDSNNMLHMAGLSLPHPQLDRIAGAALQMQRELQWFKEVESVVPPWTYEHINSESLTPRQLFTREHKQLLSDGEKWMKETATSCTVVGALIVTIMFAATFTVPGGNDEGTGYPKFLDNKTFMLFIKSDAISLFSSTTSVLMFLGILTSTYDEDDFLKSLPKKLMIGLGTLFLSIAAMMISFCAAVSVMLDDKKSWLAFFIISLAGIPITLFVLMQFPLLIEIYLSTYRPNIFNRKP